MENMRDSFELASNRVCADVPTGKITWGHYETTPDRRCNVYRVFVPVDATRSD